MKKIVLFFCTCITLIGCTSTPKVDIVAEAEVIRNLEEQWNVALQNKDVDKIMNFYASDAVSMSQNMPLKVGHQAIRERMESNFADSALFFDTYKGFVDIVEVSSSGDLAYARGHDRLSVKKADGIDEEIGKWTDVWKKIDGEWKCILTIGNSDKP
jgi:ketosteroid isomerase-like protein